MKVFEAIILLLALVGVGGAQSSKPSDVYVESWKTGNKIQEQVLAIALDRNHSERTITVHNSKGVSYN